MYGVSLREIKKAWEICFATFDEIIIIIMIIITSIEKSKTKNKIWDKSTHFVRIARTSSAMWSVRLRNGKVRFRVPIELDLSLFDGNGVLQAALDSVIFLA